MEPYELAGKILAKEGEAIWNLAGYLRVDNNGKPILRAYVAIGKDKAEEERSGEFTYDGEKWVPFHEESEQESANDDSEPTEDN